MNKTIRDIFTGMLLGDGHIRRSGVNKAYITFEQSSKKTDYFNYVKDILQKEGLDISDTKTYSRFDPRYDKTNESIHLTTKAMEELKPLADMFLDEEGKKKIPSNIGDYLTHKGLAHWIMDDGQQVKKGGVTLCTDSYKSEEISILREALKTNFNLITTIHKKRKDGAEYERIYITKPSLEEVKPQLKEHIHSSMLYKINEESQPIETSATVDSNVQPKSEISQSDIGSDFGSDID